MERGTYSKRVRDYVRSEYLEPARSRGDVTVKVVAGEVQKAVRLSNRIALICQALRSKKFLNENELVLERWDGPPSGMSTTVVFTYRLNGNPTAAAEESPLDWFDRFCGIGKEVFASLGGGEAFIRNERENFYGPGKDPADYHENQS